MVEYTSVSDEDILQHFRDVLAPYVIDHQAPQTTELFLSPIRNQEKSGETLMKEIEEILVQATDQEKQEKVSTDVSVMLHTY